LASGQASVAAATQDLLLLLLPHLARTDAAAFLQLVLTSGALTHADGGVQKRAYKALSRVLELADPPVPADALALLPPLVPEAVLGTKEPAEKARAEAFALVLAMADKFRAGGTVRRPAPEDGGDGDGDGGAMAEDGAPPAEGEDVPADLPEFVTVLAGGLAGATPHMISATVTALARVVFEYKGRLAGCSATAPLTRAQTRSRTRCTPSCSRRCSSSSAPRTARS
jgi:ribosomal RNA-processing protein 12